MGLFSPGEVRSLAKPAGAENLDTLDDVAIAPVGAAFVSRAPAERRVAAAEPDACVAPVHKLPPEPVLEPRAATATLLTLLLVAGGTLAVVAALWRRGAPPRNR